MDSAKKYHGEAATAHRQAETKQRELGYSQAADLHSKAAEAHEKALTYRKGLSNNSASGLTANDWSDAARAAAAEARKASGEAAKATSRAGSPKQLGLGKREFQGFSSPKAVKAADNAVEAAQKGEGKKSLLGQDFFHRNAIVNHEAASREHASIADSAFSQGKITAGMLHSQASQSHLRAAEAHRKATTMVGNALKNSTQQESPMTQKLSLLQRLGQMLGVYNVEQPRHPKNGQYQGKTDIAARLGAQHKGHEQASEADPDDDGDLHYEIGQGDRDPEPLDKSKVGVQSDSPDEVKRSLNKAKGEDSDDDDDDGGDDGDETTNSAKETVNSEGPMMTYGPASNSPHDATKAAGSASLMTEHPEAMDHGMKAMAASADDNPKVAARFHQKAADAHLDAAKTAMVQKEPQQADDHLQAASLHQRAATMQSATIPPVANDGGFESDEQRQAFFGHLAGGGGHDGKLGKEASEASKAASDKSASANKGSRASGHTKAAELHRTAAKAHFAAAKDATDKDTKASHAKAASEHNALAKHHESKAKTATRNRDMIPQSVIDNCKCEETKKQLLAHNAKAEGSNADIASGSGKKTVQAGGEEDTDADDYKSDLDSCLDDDIEVGDDSVKGKKSMSQNQLVKSIEQAFGMPISKVKQAVQRGMREDQKEQRTLISRLTANAANDEIRKAAWGVYQKMDLPTLRQLAAAGPQPTSNQFFNQDDDPPLNFMGATGGPVDNQRAIADNDPDDILPLPTINYKELAEEQAHKRA